MTKHERIDVSRCHDSDAIALSLSRDYFDYPICLFSQRLLQTLATWMARSEHVHFIRASCADQCAGFVFANTLGRKLWRTFARENPKSFPDLLWAFARSKLFRKWSDPQARFDHARPQGQPQKIAELDLPQLDFPFRWSEPDSRTGYVELLYVSSAFRGRHVAPLMLRALADEMRPLGVRRIEAHIDPDNYASVRAFLKADWTVARTLQNDFLTYISWDEVAGSLQSNELRRVGQIC
jgi:RimJ/RimL family protein N-acetyltransferase